MHRWHQFSLKTKNNLGRDSQRGSVSIFALLWIALTVISCVVIVRATSVVQQRAQLQEAADSIALAALTYERSSLNALAERWNVTLSAVHVIGTEAEVVVRSAMGEANSTATLAHS